MHDYKERDPEGILLFLGIRSTPKICKSSCLRNFAQGESSTHLEQVFDGSHEHSAVALTASGRRRSHEGQLGHMLAKDAKEAGANGDASVAIESRNHEF